MRAIPLLHGHGVVLVLLLCCNVCAGFTPGSVTVLRIGDGSGAVTDSAQIVFLDEYDALTGGFIASHELPSTGSTALTLSGDGDHDGHLNLSSDGQYILLGGYRADAGAANPVTQTPSAVNRVIGRVANDWSVDTSTALTDAYDRCDITAVASDTGERFWTSGEGKYLDLTNGDPNYDWKVPTTTGGLRYVTGLGDSTSINVSQTQTIPSDLEAGPWPDSIRNTRIIDGQLYITTPAWESFVNRGAYATTDPLPTSGPQTMIPVITNVEGQQPDPKGKQVPKTDVILLDLEPTVPGLDTAYTTGGKDKYEKWSLVNDIWVMVSGEALPSGQEINAFDAFVDGTDVMLFASTDQGVYSLVDTAGYNADFSDTFPMDPFIDAASNTEFRGIVYVPEPTGLLLLGLSGVALLRRRR